MKIKFIIFVLVALAGVVRADGKSPGRLSKPFLCNGKVPRESFGDATNVRLLSQLLKDKNPLTREQTVRNLGQTHNTTALPHIMKMIGDSDPTVRAAAAAAAGEFDDPLARKIVLKSLSDKDAKVVLVALDTAGRMKLSSACVQIRKLLQHEKSLVRALALRTLTLLGHPADSRQLKTLLSDASSRVRLRTCENALLSPGVSALVKDLNRLVRDAKPAVRASALAALAKFSPTTAIKWAKKFRRKKNPLLRRGAVIAYRNASKGKEVRPFLDDKSPLVVKSAVSIAGEMRQANCAERLFKIMLITSDNDLHFSARKSLKQIGTKKVIQLAGRYLESEVKRHSKLKTSAKNQKTLSQSDRRDLAIRVGRVERNMRSCCNLLWHFKSRNRFALRMNLLTSLKIDSPILLDLVPSLAVLNDKSVVKPLDAILKRCRTQGRKWLIEQQKMMPAYVEYDNAVTATIIIALGEMRSVKSLNRILAVINTTVRGSRLNLPTTAAGRAFVKLTTPANLPKIEKAVLKALDGRDRGYCKAAIFEMCRTAGKLKFKKAIPALKKILNEDRFSRMMMHSAAWAIQEITGKTPPIGDPSLNQDNNWIIRQKIR